VKAKYGDLTDEEFFQHLFKDGPELCGQTCAWLASGQGKDLRGLFLGMFSYDRAPDICQLIAVDCRQDVSILLNIGRKTLLNENRNRLTVNFVEGYCNEP
jgi:hypothetical protein